MYLVILLVVMLILGLFAHQYRRIRWLFLLQFLARTQPFSALRNLLVPQTPP